MYRNFKGAKVLVHGWQPSNCADVILSRVEFGELAKALFPAEYEVTYSGWDVGEGQRGWHKDCGGNDQLLLLWANKNPTKVRYRRGEKWVYLKSRPGDVVLIDNRTADHSAPHTLDPGRYWGRVVLKKTTT